jgi:dolichyl-phosphate beta-glucosyltransferase
VSQLSGHCALVVPCFNEARRLNSSEYIRFLETTPSGFRLIFVDDGSTDTTLNVLEAICAATGGERAIVLPKKPNAGKADAVRYGMNYGLKLPEIDVVGFWDADLATPLPAVYDLLRILENHPGIQMVFGARVQLLGRHIRRRAVRHYLGRVFATAVSNVLQLPVYDTQCGAKLFRASAEFAAVIRDPFLSRWIFDVEIIARFIQRRGAQWVYDAIYEYPLEKWEDIAGSKVKSGDFIKAAAEIFAIWNKYLRK